MLLVVDSSVFVAAFRPEEPAHQAARSLLLSLRSGENAADCPLTVLLEVGAAIRRRTGSQELASRVVQLLRDVDHLRFSPFDALSGASALHVALATALRGMDAIVVARAVDLGAPLASFDLEMLQRAQPLVPLFAFTGAPA
ncbi:MAG: PIN domain-containing protein [Chloroflexota bacterium]